MKTTRNTRIMQFVALLFLVNIAVALVPTLWFDSPITQTDGAYYYAIAKTWAQGSVDSEISANISAVGSAQDYPPALIWVYKTMLQLFDADLLVMNGALIALLFVIGNIFVFRLVRAITKDTWIATLVTAYAVLNIRSYYMLFGGIHPTLAGISLSYIALYYFYGMLQTKKTKYIILAIALNVLVTLTHFATIIYLGALELALVIGLLLTKRIKLTLPTIKIDIKKGSYKDFIPLGVLAVPFIILVLNFIPRAGQASHEGVSVYLRSWVATLLGYGPGGYQNVWEVFVLFDGPILFVLSAIGFVYLFYTQKWVQLSLVGMGVLFVYAKDLLFPVKDIWIVHYFHNFYPIWTVLMALAAAYIFKWMIEKKTLKKLGYILIVCSLLYQLVQVGLLVSLIEPALSNDELSSVDYLKNSPYNDRVFFYDNAQSFGWRNFYWSQILADSSQPTLTADFNLFDTSQKYDAVMVADASKLTQEELNTLSTYSPVHTSGVVNVFI